MAAGLPRQPRHPADTSVGRHTRVGGTFMRKRLVGAFASAMFVFAACQGASSPAPSSQASTGTAPSAATSGEPTGSGAAPSASGAATGGVDLFNTTYNTRRAAAPSGGKVIYADWQEATEFNYYYQAQVTEA